MCLSNSKETGVKCSGMYKRERGKRLAREVQ